MEGNRRHPPKDTSTFYARVTVVNKPEIDEPQGIALTNTARRLGFEGVLSIRQGKAFHFEVEAPDKDAAQKLTDNLSTGLLSNRVIEDVTTSKVSTTTDIYNGNIKLKPKPEE